MTCRLWVSPEIRKVSEGSAGNPVIFDDDKEDRDWVGGDDDNEDDDDDDDSDDSDNSLAEWKPAHPKTSRLPPALPASLMLLTALPGGYLPRRCPYSK